jgi:putative FmdB family regulatory protein
MPIFEYRCEGCGTKFEKLLRRDSDAAGLACPSCGEGRVARQLSTFAAHAAASKPAQPMACPSGGVCRTPGMCGQTFN